MSIWPIYHERTWLADSLDLYFCPEVAVTERLFQNRAGRLILAGRVMKAGEAVEVIVGGNWYRAQVRKIQGRWDLILETGREISAVGLVARLRESNQP